MHVWGILYLHAMHITEPDIFVYDKLKVLNVKVSIALSLSHWAAASTFRQAVEFCVHCILS